MSELRQAIDRQATGGSLVPQNDTKLGYRADSLLPGLWAEAVIPTELIYGSLRVLAYDEVVQDLHRREDAVLLEENRLRATKHAARYQQALCRYHSHNVHARSFEEGDLVLRRVQFAKGTNKLTAKWEGPYRVV